MTAATTSTGTARSHTLAFSGLVLLSLCLRGPLVAVSTVSTDLSAGLGMSATAVGLLTRRAAGSSPSSLSSCCARTVRENRQLSSIVQTGGYSVAALGPVVLGGLHDSTGGWTASLLVAVVAVAALTILGSLAAHGVRG